MALVRYVILTDFIISLGKWVCGPSPLQSLFFLELLEMHPSWVTFSRDLQTHESKTEKWIVIRACFSGGRREHSKVISHGKCKFTNSHSREKAKEKKVGIPRKMSLFSLSWYRLWPLYAYLISMTYGCFWKRKGSAANERSSLYRISEFNWVLVCR